MPRLRSNLESIFVVYRFPNSGTTSSNSLRTIFIWAERFSTSRKCSCPSQHRLLAGRRRETKMATAPIIAQPPAAVANSPYTVQILPLNIQENLVQTLVESADFQAIPATQQ